MSTQRNKLELFQRLGQLGFTYEESVQLRRIEMTLQRWAELECGDSNDYASVGIERDETTGKPYRVYMPHNLPPSKATRTLIPDREKGALNRLKEIMARHSELVAYYQGDCRGCMLYIVRKSDLVQDGRELPIDQHYTRGLAVAA